MTSPQGMDAEYFLKTFGDDAAFNEPWIYILRQDPQIPDPPYYRCGAAGTQLFPDADRPYQASETSRKGLAGRVTQYIGHIRPNKVLLFAALRIKRAVVALEGQRIGGDATTGLYNITRGNQSAVLAAEAVMHHLHDKDRNINRFPEHPDSELFRPSSGVNQLIKNIIQETEKIRHAKNLIKGEPVFLITKSSARYSAKLEYKSHIAAEYITCYPAGLDEQPFPDPDLAPRARKKWSSPRGGCHVQCS